MSSLVSIPATLGHPVMLSPQKRSAVLLRRFAEMAALAGVTQASRLEVRPAPARVTTGIQEMDSLTGGLPRGCVTEICGAASSGRTSVLLSTLASATQRQEVCALVDTSDALDPQSALAAGVDLQRLLWVRCGGKNYSPQRHRATQNGAKRNKTFSAAESIEQALRVLDLLLQSGGFGLVVVDFGDVPFVTARRIPLASWFRFQRAVENTPTVMLVIAQAACAQTCASVVVKLRGKKASDIRRQASGSPGAMPPHAQLLEGTEIEGELLRSRLERKPVQSVKTTFATHAVRAGRAN